MELNMKGILWLIKNRILEYMEFSVNYGINCMAFKRSHGSGSKKVGHWLISNLQPKLTYIYENEKASSKVPLRVKLTLYYGHHSLTGN